MIHLMTLAVFLVASTAGPAHALKVCPFEALQRDMIIKEITETTDCSASFEVLSACQTNTSGDVEFADGVIEKCEKTFLPSLKPDRLRAYAKARRMCDDKYAKTKGTMYASARAICKATVAVRFAK
jgi:hypothetical protein